jgi:hypothetical protein
MRFYVPSTLVSEVIKDVMSSFRTDSTVSESTASHSHSTLSETASAVQLSSAGVFLCPDTWIGSLPPHFVIEVTVEGEEVIDPDTMADDVLGDNKQQPVEV